MAQACQCLSHDEVQPRWQHQWKVALPRFRPAFRTFAPRLCAYSAGQHWKLLLQQYCCCLRPAVPCSMIKLIVRIWARVLSWSNLLEITPRPTNEWCKGKLREAKHALVYTNYTAALQWCFSSSQHGPQPDPRNAAPSRNVLLWMNNPQTHTLQLGSRTWARGFAGLLPCLATNIRYLSTAHQGSWSTAQTPACQGS